MCCFVYCTPDHCWDVNFSEERCTCSSAYSSDFGLDSAHRSYSFFQIGHHSSICICRFWGRTYAQRFKPYAGTCLLLVFFGKFFDVADYFVYIIIWQDTAIKVNEVFSRHYVHSVNIFVFFRSLNHIALFSAISIKLPSSLPLSGTSSRSSFLNKPCSMRCSIPYLLPCSSSETKAKAIVRFGFIPNSFKTFSAYIEATMGG